MSCRRTSRLLVIEAASLSWKPQLGWHRFCVTKGSHLWSQTHPVLSGYNKSTAGWEKCRWVYAARCTHRTMSLPSVHPHPGKHFSRKASPALCWLPIRARCAPGVSNWKVSREALLTMLVKVTLFVIIRYAGIRYIWNKTEIKVILTYSIAYEKYVILPGRWMGDKVLVSK